jgi:hypothetical protein
VKRLSFEFEESDTKPNIGDSSDPGPTSDEVEFLDGVEGREDILTSVGLALILAASPDKFDGISDAEFHLLEKLGTGFGIYELLGRLGVPDSFRLPEGFAKHFSNEVIPDLSIIRQDKEMIEAFRKELKYVLSHPEVRANLYRKGGVTYSDIATHVAKTFRKGKFYNPSFTLPSSGLHSNENGNRRSKAKRFYAMRRRKGKKR